jgi:hypothetical protein
MSEVKKELSHWWIISFEHQGKPVEEGRILWGVPVEFDGETWCCTSLIESVDGEYVKTRNSTYKLIGEGDEITLPLSDIERLRVGFSPANCIEMREMERSGYKIEKGPRKK